MIKMPYTGDCKIKYTRLRKWAERPPVGKADYNIRIG